MKTSSQGVPMQLSHLYLDIKHDDPKLILLYRFHVVLIFINLFAVIIDTFMQRYNNVAIEFVTILLLIFSLTYLRRSENVKVVAHIFIVIITSALLLLIYLNHFASMSLVFIMLLPLTTLLFLELKESLIMTALLFASVALLLYLEHLYNPANPLTQNPQALFNLLYTAVIIYIFGLLYHFSILKTFKELDDANLQKALLLKEVHHRVKNNLNVIASIIGLQENRLEGKEKEELLKSKSRIESIALVHEMLYRHEDFENIDFSAYMRKLSDLLLAMYANDKAISVEISSETRTVSLNIMVQLGIMVNELLTNSIKYAFDDHDGTIRIGLTQEEEHYRFTYEDDGKGHPAPERLKQSDSLGIKLIYLTARQLKGSVEVSSEKGLHYDIRFEK